jgi:hypothetical protein
VVRSTNFYYEHPEYAEEGQLDRDTMLFFNQNCAPLVSYELNVVDLRRNPDYKMFSNNYRFKVGDKGRVWDERLQAWLELEITRTEHDIITGDCVKVVIGTQRSFTRPVGYQPVIPKGIIIPAAEKVLEGLVPLYFNSAADKLIDWTIYGAEGGVGKRTANLLEDKLIGMTWWNGLITADERFTLYITEVKPNTTYTASGNNNSEKNIMVMYCSVYPAEGQPTINGERFVYPTDAEHSVATFTTPNYENMKYIAVRFTVTATNIMLSESAEELPYEPYGYTIPVTISQSDPVYYRTNNGDRYGTQEGVYRLADEAQSQTVSIPIDHPLEDGESISRADTGIDIPTYHGENTLDVDTTVKPRAKITYKEG